MSSIRFDNVSKHQCAITIVDEHDDLRIQRYYSPGNDISKITRVRSVAYDDTCDIPVPVQRVPTLNEYNYGCTMHEDGCRGSMCINDRKVVLYPQSFSLSMGVFMNEISRLTTMAYQSYGMAVEEKYLTGIKNIMLTKHGILRGVNSGGVEGSARLVLSPCWDIGEGEIALPISMRDKFKYPALAKDNAGNDTSIVEECRLYEGDWVIFLRPPSLWLGNVQPKKVKFWENNSIGLHPANCKAFHADFDGDEGHIYPIRNSASIKEAEAWRPIHESKFRDMALDFLSNRGSSRSIIRPSMIEAISMDDSYDYVIRECERLSMAESTISMRDIMDGIKPTTYAKAAGIKQELFDEFRSRMGSSTTSDNFISECLRGITDIMYQQTSQGDIGTMTREARLSAQCFKYSSITGVAVLTLE